MILRRLFLALTLAAALAGAGGPARAQPPSLAERLDAALAPLGPHAIAAVRVLDADRGTVLYERNADLSLNPASNMKLFTSAAAMAKLGGSHTFTTRVGVRSRKSGRRTVEDLVLQGGGDPVLETADLEQLAEAVRAAGLRRVRGELLVDDTRYDDRRLGAAWSAADEPYYYSAQISALTVNRNVTRVRVAPGAKPDDPVRAVVADVPRLFQVRVSATTAAAGTRRSVEVSRARARNVILVTGAVPAGSAPIEEDVTFEDPAALAGELFKDLLGKRGVRVDGVVRRVEAPIEGMRELAAHASPPLARILPLLNKPSDNLIAELLLKELGCVVRGRGTARDGSEAVEAWLKELGIDTGGVRVNDGSGLSRMDLVTARAVSDLLLKIRGQPWFTEFSASLPVAGMDGTLRSRMKGTPAAGNLRAKTGSLTHVTALSGYLKAASGQELVLSVLITHPGVNAGPRGAKAVEDAIAVALASWSGAEE